MKILKTPLSQEEINRLHVGDVVYLTGTFATCRDAGHERLLSGVTPETDLKDGAIFHAGPIVRPTDNGYEMVAIGPTTSMRMERMEAEFIEKTGVKMIIGKGGMGKATADACVKHGVVHCVFPGGCAVVAGSAVKRIKTVEWQDLGMPEAFWVCECDSLGPLIVSIDTEGNNMFEEHKAQINQNLPGVKQELKEDLDRILGRK